jgi:SAM-dependent methyltransferase
MKLKKNSSKVADMYRKMGAGYLQDIKTLVLPELSCFIKLIPRGGRVLDIGCAGGRDCAVLAQRGFKVMGIDLVVAFLKEAKRLVPKAKFVRMDLLGLRFPANYFDAIWTNAVLHHLEKKDLAVAFDGFHRILKPDGKLYLITKQGQGLVCRKDKFSQQKRSFLLLSKKDLTNYAISAGLKVRFIKTISDVSGRKNVKWLALSAEKK